MSNKLNSKKELFDKAFNNYVQSLVDEAAIIMLRKILRLIDEPGMNFGLLKEQIHSAIKNI